MKIDDALLEKLQTLGMIRIDESKKEEIKKQLSDIIGFVDNLAHISTDEIQIQNASKN